MRTAAGAPLVGNFLSAQVPDTPLGRHAVLVSSRDPRSRVDHGRMTVLRTTVAALSESFDQVTVFHLRPADTDRGEGPVNAAFHHLSSARARRAAHAVRCGLVGHHSLNEIAGIDGQQRAAMRRYLRRHPRPDLVVLDGTRAAAAIAEFEGVPALVDLDDLLSDRYRAWADLPFDRLPFDVVGTNPSSPYNVVARRLRPLLPLVLRAEARSVAGIEQMIAERADRVSLVSPREAATFASRTGRIVDVLPMAAPRVPERPWAAPAAPEFDAVFLGRTTHLTNLAALDWLGREVLPRLGERLGRAPRVGVAGASSPSVDAWMTELALEPLGYVPDLQLLFAAASCAVAPQVVGGGMNTKVLDYATHGVPVVGTTHAFAGLVAGDELDGHGIDDAGVFADRIARLRADREMAQAFGGAARAHVDAYYRAPVVQARWRHAFKTAINSSEGVHA